MKKILKTEVEKNHNERNEDAGQIPFSRFSPKLESNYFLMTESGVGAHTKFDIFPKTNIESNENDRIQVRVYQIEYTKEWRSEVWMLIFEYSFIVNVARRNTTARTIHL